ncbi:hypothetical protein [Dyadobacter arcticus]|uniref:Outer membrane protein beta-barrel domain-containing protein n=1 Tax=Dyadobacter arcticus TaxID=1078754 RepID=A0ABX0UIZ4_9BACT|nr:hypothetical protein [Dyadobacter arcticus]NIJ52064.1 hypothetical protein [Dyadobacter arcticus]
MLRAITLSVILSLLIFSAKAQDILVKRNGKTIDGKVTEVGIDRVSYKISNDANSAVFVIRKSELNRIEFQNGQTVFLNDRIESGGKRAEVVDTEDYGRSMVSFSPFKALDSGPGIGLSYEFLVDKRKYIGVILPFTMTFPDRYNYLFDSAGNRSEMYYFSPGLKIYPFGQRKVTYAVGPHVFTGFGRGYTNSSIYDPVTGIYKTVQGRVTNFRLGVMVNNYINFQITPRFQLGLNAGLGSRYVDRETTPSNVTNRGGINITGEFNFSFGLRF